MNKLTTISIATVFVWGALSSACTPGHNVAGSTFAGAAAGGLLGAAFFHGSGAPIGILGGALVGGVIGNFIGNRMDERDRERMDQAITRQSVEKEVWVEGPRGRHRVMRKTEWSESGPVRWTNRHGVTYTVTPLREIPRHHRHHRCREYKVTVKMDGRRKHVYGQACRMNDGRWHIVK